MEESVRFYRDKLGFQTEETADSPEVIFFNTHGTKFELFPLSNLVKDINSENPPEISNGFSGITLAYNVPSKVEVDKVIELARAAGATIVKEPIDVFWGGYHAYFSDPDGYFWEVAWGPDFKYDENGLLIF
ncbi:Glyoxalase/bleomycin resistance protein/dioxygenase [Listeria floridensis FSL S10-1187]|uniref:Glyoxalase/bleomycin resistance protein/dioxygenase n=2 Tax=Listeria floridensis TaxID=1494962 RepID=A0ABP3AU52_9LIST|nr:Glyoxalase/bleomycin resistance protein/dioxygenase [Listeria floridensis FSL S10-1187]